MGRTGRGRETEGLTTLSPGTCRVCGCTDTRGCEDWWYGSCSWTDASHTLCSVCEDGEFAADAAEDVLGVDHVYSRCAGCGAVVDGEGDDCGSCDPDGEL